MTESMHLAYTGLAVLMAITAAGILLLVRDLRRRVVRRARTPAASVPPSQPALQQQVDTLVAEIDGLRAAIRSLRSELAARETAALPLALPRNLQRKLLRFEECGSTPEQIAGILRIPKPEVEFLLKVEKMQKLQNGAALHGNAPRV